jgi:hypothetical protein
MDRLAGLFRLISNATGQVLSWQHVLEHAHNVRESNTICKRSYLVESMHGQLWVDESETFESVFATHCTQIS